MEALTKLSSYREKVDGNGRKDKEAIKMDNAGMVRSVWNGGHRVRSRFGDNAGLKFQQMTRKEFKEPSED